MEIKILTPVDPLPVYNHKYEIVHKWMFGDGDGYENGTIFVDSAKSYLLPHFFAFLERLKLAHPNGKGGDDGYEWVPGWEIYKPSDIYLNSFENEDKELNKITLEVPGGGYGFDEEIPSFDGYDVFCHDAEGVKRNVSVVLSKEELTEIQEEMKPLVKKNSWMG